jgi:hypothetical protein
VMSALSPVSERAAESAALSFDHLLPYLRFVCREHVRPGDDSEGQDELRGRVDFGAVGEAGVPVAEYPRMAGMVGRTAKMGQ